MVIGIVANTRKRATPDAASRFLRELAERNLPAIVDEDLESLITLDGDAQFGSIDEMRTNADAVAVFGGDGTMLNTGRRFAGSNVPLIGFNLGRLGFLAEFPVEEMGETIDAVRNGEVRIVERSLLEAQIEGDAEGFIAINDIVVDKRETRLLVKLAVHVDGEYLGTYSADGLIVATPTGSTAYALAVGGPVVAPNAGVIVLAPIAPHMLTARPVVLSDSVELKITPVIDHGEWQEVRIIADGQDSRHFSSPRSVIIRRHPDPVRLVKSADRTYFDVLRAKLLWGRRPSLPQEDGHDDDPEM